MDSDDNFEYLKNCVKYKETDINLSGDIRPKDKEEFEYLLSKLSGKNINIYVHGFNFRNEGGEDSYMSSICKGISGNIYIKELCYSRMHLTKSSLSWHLKLLETNPDLKIMFTQDNKEIDTFRILQDIKKNRKI
jgi:hypothetical protein